MAMSMPEAAASTAPSIQKATHAVNPDRVGEELADDATIWHVYDRVAKEDDERRTKSWDNGLNNLALFAGLFSAVTTAFIIEAQQDMEPDYAQLTFLLLNATASGKRFVQEPFIIPPNARTANCLWVSSLVLSLSAALIAIMGKDWIGTYTSRPVCNPRQWAEMRTYRLRCVERWYMPGVIAAAPVLLHVSLLLFGAGLVLFISSDPFTHRLTLGLCSVAASLYLVTALSAIIFSSSPFKSPATKMLRRALSAVLSRTRGILVYRPKRNLVGTLLGSINAMLVPHVNESALPGLYMPEPCIPQRPRSIKAALSACRSGALAFARSLFARLRTARKNLRWSDAKLRVEALVSASCTIQTSDWFTSSTWTDLSVHRRPELVAESLSWLNGASQAPDVFRALIFALGDLEIGGTVAPMVSQGLRSRISAETKRTMHQVDFLTLSRYVLAYQNLRCHISTDFWHCFNRFDLEKDRSLLCEDGLAAAIVLGSFSWITRVYIPEHVSHARMSEFLLPRVVHPQHRPAETFILLANAYKSHLTAHKSFNFEAELHHRLNRHIRREYRSIVKNQYGRPGAIELLTFLCCHTNIVDAVRKAAVELIMHILAEDQRQKIRIHRAAAPEPVVPHRCLAYLFGGSRFQDATWPEKSWPGFQLYYLSKSLTSSMSPSYDPQPPSAHRHDLNVALAHAMVRLLSPRYDTIGNEGICIRALFTLICHKEGGLNPEATLEIVRLLLEDGTLHKIVGRGIVAWLIDDSVIDCAVAILVTITNRVSGLLRDTATRRMGEHLFERLVFAEVKQNDDGTVTTWDLGDWIRTRAPELADDFPCAVSQMQHFHDALSAIHPLCDGNEALRAIWDRLGFPQHQGNIFPYPFHDVGKFFRNAEGWKEHLKLRPSELDRLIRVFGL